MAGWVTLSEAAARLGMSRVQVRESGAFAILEDPGRGARVRLVDVERWERRRADEKRRREIEAARRVANLDRDVAETDAWLDSIQARSVSPSLLLEDLRAKNEAKKDRLAKLRAEYAAGVDEGRPPGREPQRRAAGELETQALKLRADRIARRFKEREAARDAERAARSTREAGLEPGWSDADWLSPQLQQVLRRYARRARRRGKAYSTTLNGTSVAVLGSGRIVINDGGAGTR